MKVKFRINGKEVSKEEWDAHEPCNGAGMPLPPTTAYNSAKPQESLALSCHRDLARSYNEEAHRQGLTGIKWHEKTGDCTITSALQREEWLRSQRQHDEDSFN